MNLKEMALELGLEQDEFSELLTIFIETSESDLNRLQDAIAEGNAEGASDAAHYIKGASASLGFMEIHSVAKNLEQKARQKSLEGLTDEILFIKERLSLIEKSKDEI